MIILTRLSGATFAVNPDLIERADCTPDTVITLVDGTKYLVTEPIDVLMDRVMDFRARVIARSYVLEREVTSPLPEPLHDHHHSAHQNGAHQNGAHQNSARAAHPAGSSLAARADDDDHVVVPLHRRSAENGGS